MRSFSNFIDEANTTTTADKKDELYTDPNTGKLKARKVPVDTNIIKRDYTTITRKTSALQEETDKSLFRLQQLARAGMMDQGQLPQLTRALKALGTGKVVNPQDRQILLDLLNELIGVITGDDSIFAKAKSTIKKG